MTIKTIRYFHVDDEVVRVSWIPNALRTCYYQKHKNYFNAAKPLEHEEGSSLWSFNLFGSDLEAKVEYTIFDTGEELLELSDSDLKDSIFILDLMAHDNTQDGQVPVGNDTFCSLLARGIDKSDIYVLTAFELAACQILDDLDRDHILTKPINTTLAPVLLEAVGVIIHD